MKDSQQKKDTTKKKTTTRANSSTTSSKKQASEKGTRSRRKIELYDLETNNADLEKTLKIDVVTENMIPKKKESKKIDKDSISDLKEEKLDVKEVIIERKTGFNILEVIIIIIIALCMGGFIGGGLVHYYDKSSNEGAIIPKKFNELVETYEEILSNYYEDISSSELIDAGIKGMLDHLDDSHSIYIDKEESESFNQSLNGQLIGIGVEIRKAEDGTIVVNYPFENGPAFKAGIKSGDIIIGIDNRDISDLTFEEASDLIKGKSGTSVKLTITRDGKEMDFSVVRTIVEIPSVVSAAFNRNGKNVGYLGISIFAKNTYSQVKEKLNHLEKNKIDSLIIDVRGNSGGHLDVVLDIASLFLEKNKIVYKLDTKGIVENIYATSKESRDYPIAVLINGTSASASEILAGALRDSYSGSIDLVGVSSYGKGTVQTSHKLDSGAIIKYTHQKWLTPNGEWIDGKGINPTLPVELDEAYMKNPSDDLDNQLQRAIDLLSQK
ncbi:MAG: S41 family peptidase [Bacilli bacterium]|nr:S41 family peptidase [Bacilli bacterium]